MSVAAIYLLAWKTVVSWECVFIIMGADPELHSKRGMGSMRIQGWGA